MHSALSRTRSYSHNSNNFVFQLIFPSIAPVAFRIALIIAPYTDDIAVDDILIQARENHEKKLGYRVESEGVEVK